MFGDVTVVEGNREQRIVPTGMPLVDSTRCGSRVLTVTIEPVRLPLESLIGKHLIPP